MIAPLGEVAAQIPLMAMLVWAAIIDVRSRRIPNWLTLTVVVTGLAINTLGVNASPLRAIYGLMVGFGITLILHMVGGLGAGDVKLMAGIGAWIGPQAVLYVFAAAAIVGMVIILAKCAYQGRLTQLFKNTGLMLANIVNAKRLGAAHVINTGTSTRTVTDTLPFAVAILVGALAVLWAPTLMWMR